MRPGGLLLILGGVWVLCQVLGGNALERLGVIAGPDKQVPGSGEFPNVPDHGYNNVPHNAQGYPL